MSIKNICIMVVFGILVSVWVYGFQVVRSKSLMEKILKEENKK